MIETRWNSQATMPFIVAAGALLPVAPEPDAEYLDEPSLMFLTGPPPTSAGRSATPRRWPSDRRRT